MKLLVLGVFTRESTCVGFARGLERAGAQVRTVCFGGSMVPASPGRRSKIRDLELMITEYRPDKILIMKGAFLEVDEISYLSSRYDTVFVTFDTITCGPPGRAAHLGPRARACKSAIATGSEAVEWLRAQGLPAVQMIQGFRPEIWKPNPGVRPGRHLGFVGHTYQGDGGRAEKLALIRRAGVRVETVGYPQPLFLENAAQFNAQCAAVLNFVPQRDPGSFSNRVIRALACGVPVISEWCRDLEEILSDAPGLRLWKTEEELLSLCQGAVSEVAGASERGRIAKWARDNFTWDHQAGLAYDFLTGEARATETRQSDVDFLLEQAKLAESDGLEDSAMRFRAIAERIQ